MDENNDFLVGEIVKAPTASEGAMQFRGFGPDDLYVVEKIRVGYVGCGAGLTTIRHIESDRDGSVFTYRLVKLPFYKQGDAVTIVANQTGHYLEMGSVGVVMDGPDEEGEYRVYGIDVHGDEDYWFLRPDDMEPYRDEPYYRYYTYDAGLPKYETTLETYTEEAERLVNGPRRGDYGHPLDDFTTSAEFITLYLQKKGVLYPGATLVAEDIPELMQFIKLSREIHSHKRDNDVDRIGYLRTKEMCIHERAVRGDEGDALELW